MPHTPPAPQPAGQPVPLPPPLPLPRFPSSPSPVDVIAILASLQDQIDDLAADLAAGLAAHQAAIDRLTAHVPVAHGHQ